MLVHKRVCDAEITDVLDLFDFFDFFFWLTWCTQRRQLEKIYIKNQHPNPETDRVWTRFLASYYFQIKTENII